LIRNSIERAENSLSYADIGQFVMLPHTFIKNSKKRKLLFHSRWLFVALMYYRNGQTGYAFPSYDKICELTGLRRNMISKCIRELETAGWISRKKRFNASTIYTLHFPTPDGSFDGSQRIQEQDSYQIPGVHP